MQAIDTKDPKMYAKRMCRGAKLPHLVIPNCPAPKQNKSSTAITPFCRRPTRAIIRSSRRSGRGAMIEDVDGNTFLDFAAGIAVFATGPLPSRGRRRDSEAGGRN